MIWIINIDSDNILREKAFNITESHEYDGYQRGIASMVYKFFDKKSLTHKRTGINSENQQTNYYEI